MNQTDLIDPSEGYQKAKQFIDEAIERFRLKLTECTNEHLVLIDDHFYEARFIDRRGMRLVLQEESDIWDYYTLDLGDIQGDHDSSCQNSLTIGYSTLYGWILACDNSPQTFERLARMDARAAKMCEMYWQKRKPDSDTSPWHGQYRLVASTLDPIWYLDPTSRYFLSLIDIILHTFCS